MCPLVPEALMFSLFKNGSDSLQRATLTILDPATTAIAEAGKKLGEEVDGGNGMFSKFHRLVTPAMGQGTLAEPGKRGVAIMRRGAVDAAIMGSAFGGAALLGGAGATSGAGAGSSGSILTTTTATGETVSYNGALLTSGASGTTAASGATAAAGAGAGASTSSSISPLLATALGLEVAGGLMGSAGSYQQGVAESDELKRQARLEETRANLAYESAAQEKRDLQRKQRQQIGKARTMAAANGVLIDSLAFSSPNIYTQDALDEVKYESDKIDYNTELEAYTRRENASIMRKNAQTVRRAGKLKAATGLISTAANALKTYVTART